MGKLTGVYRIAAEMSADGFETLRSNCLRPTFTTNRDGSWFGVDRG